MASGLRIIEQLKVERLSTNKPATKYSERLFRCESGREAHQHPRTRQADFIRHSVTFINRRWEKVGLAMKRSRTVV